MNNMNNMNNMNRELENILENITLEKEKEIAELKREIREIKQKRQDKVITFEDYICKRDYLETILELKNFNNYTNLKKMNIIDKVLMEITLRKEIAELKEELKKKLLKLKQLENTKIEQTKL